MDIYEFSKSVRVYAEEAYTPLKEPTFHIDTHAGIRNASVGLTIHDYLPFEEFLEKTIAYLEGRVEYFIFIEKEFEAEGVRTVIRMLNEAVVKDDWEYNQRTVK